MGNHRRTVYGGLRVLSKRPQRDYYRDVRFYNTADQALSMAVSAFTSICKAPYQGVSLHNEWQQEVADKLQLEYEITQEKTLDE